MLQTKLQEQEQPAATVFFSPPPTPHPSCPPIRNAPDEGPLLRLGHPLQGIAPVAPDRTPVLGRAVADGEHHAVGPANDLSVGVVPPNLRLDPRGKGVADNLHLASLALALDLQHQPCRLVLPHEVQGK